MYKLVILPLLFAAVSAGYLGGGHLAAAPLAVAAPAVHAAPLAAVHAAPLAVAHAPVATSYANTYKVSVSQPVAVAHAAPAVVAAPVALGHGYHG